MKKGIQIMDTIANYKQLGYAIALQAIRDFFKTNSERSKAKIIKDLKSPYMDLLTNGLSIILAEKLETNPAEIEARIKKQESEEETNET
jgi:hypothetical protein